MSTTTNNNGLPYDFEGSIVLTPSDMFNKQGKRLFNWTLIPRGELEEVIGEDGETSFRKSATKKSTAGAKRRVNDYPTYFHLGDEKIILFVDNDLIKMPPDAHTYEWKKQGGLEFFDPEKIRESQWGCDIVPSRTAGVSLKRPNIPRQELEKYMETLEPYGGRIYFYRNGIQLFVNGVPIETWVQISLSKEKNILKLWYYYQVVGSESESKPFKRASTFWDELNEIVDDDVPPHTHRTNFFDRCRVYFYQGTKFFTVPLAWLIPLPYRLDHVTKDANKKTATSTTKTTSKPSSTTQPTEESLDSNHSKSPNSDIEGESIPTTIQATESAIVPPEEEEEVEEVVQKPTSKQSKVATREESDDDEEEEEVEEVVQKPTSKQSKVATREESDEEEEEEASKSSKKDVNKRDKKDKKEKKKPSKHGKSKN